MNRAHYLSEDCGGQPRARWVVARGRHNAFHEQVHEISMLAKESSNNLGEIGLLVSRNTFSYSHPAHNGGLSHLGKSRRLQGSKN